MDDRTRTQLQPPDPADSTVAQTSDQMRESAELTRPVAGERSEGDYELREEIARGGMGVVHRAYDRRFGRDVAIKTLHADLRHDATALHRFLSEAKITARLEHPGVPPIHDLGSLPDGRPFLAMKLIHGRTLADLLAGRSSHDLGDLLGVFEKICQAVGFAHRRGIVHRDLKPANVMVGEFGEVQVMDWGIAKDRSAADLSSADAAPCAADGDTRTQVGTIVGTPSFMSPEQARGETDAVSERTDVFGLGAILCVLLTGRPPFVAAGAVDTVVLAAAGNLTAAFARLDGCDADPELVSLAKLCLSPRAADRLVDGAAVADAVAAYRAGVEEKLRTVEVERAQAAVRAAEGRKRRRVAYALAVSVLAFLGLSAGGAWWANREATLREAERIVRDGATRAAVESALAHADGAVREGKVDDADLMLGQIQPRLDEFDAADLRQQIDALRFDIRTVRELDAATEVRWSIRERRPDPPPADAAVATRQLREADEQERAFRTAFERAGVVPRVDTAADTGRRVADSRIAARLVGGLDEWLEMNPGEAGLTEVLAVADPDPLRTAVRAALARRDYADIRRRLAAVDGGTLPPSFAAVVGSRTVLPPADSERLLKPAYDRHRDSFPLAVSLGAAAMNHARTEYAEVVGYFRAATALRPSNVRARLLLSSALSYSSRHEEAIREAEAACALAPGSPRPINTLASSYVLAGRYAEGEAAYARSFAAAATGQTAHDAYLGLGGLQFDRADYPAAVTSYRQARGCVADHATATAYLGDALEADGRLDEALTRFREAAGRPDAGSSYPQFRLALACRDGRRYREADEQLRPVWGLPVLVVEEVYPLAADVAIELGEYRRAADLAVEQLRKLPPESPARPRAETLRDYCDSLLKLAEMTDGERDRQLVAGGTDLLTLFHQAEFYRTSGRWERADRTYRSLHELATRTKFALNSRILIATARTAVRHAPTSLAARNRARRCLWEAAEAMGQSHSSAPTPGTKLLARKSVLYLLADADFAAVREEAPLNALPPAERQPWQAVWARLRAVATRSDAPVREASPTARELSRGK